MAIVDMAARLDPAVRVLTIDTGRLPAETLDMIRRVREVYGIEVEVSRPDPGEAEEMVGRHGLDLFRDSVSPPPPVLRNPQGAPPRANARRCRRLGPPVFAVPNRPSAATPPSWTIPATASS